MSGLGFIVQGLGFIVQGLGFRFSVVEGGWVQSVYLLLFLD